MLTTLAFERLLKKALTHVFLPTSSGICAWNYRCGPGGAGENSVKARYVVAAAVVNEALVVCTVVVETEVVIYTV